MKNKNITWTAVIDGRNAHFYTKQPEFRLKQYNYKLTAKPKNDNRDLGLVEDRITNYKLDLSYSLTAKPINENEENKSNLGRVHDRMGEGKHIMEPPTSEEDKNNESFAREVKEFLEDSLERGRYNRLIVVASPKILSLLRKMLSKPVRDSVALELDKDFTHLTPKQIQENLEKIVHI